MWRTSVRAARLCLVLLLSNKNCLFLGQRQKLSFITQIKPVRENISSGVKGVQTGRMNLHCTLQSVTFRLVKDCEFILEKWKNCHQRLDGRLLLHLPSWRMKTHLFNDFTLSPLISSSSTSNMLWCLFKTLFLLFSLGLIAFLTLHSHSHLLKGHTKLYYIHALIFYQEQISFKWKHHLVPIIREQTLWGAQRE